MRVRENAESIAFYSGEAAEGRLLFERLGAVVENYVKLIRTSRNLEFFTSFYRCAHLNCGQATSCSGFIRSASKQCAKPFCAAAALAIC